MAEKPNGQAEEPIEGTPAGPVDDDPQVEETPDLAQVLAEGYDEIQSREDEGEQPAVSAPEHWSDDDKQLLASLPDDETRQKVLGWRKAIETNASTKTEEAAALKREYGEIDEVMKPLEPELQSAGLGKADAVKRLVGAHQLLSSDPARGLEQIAQTYGRSGAGPGQAQEIVRRVATALGVDAGGSQKAGQAASDPTASRVEALERTVREQQQAQQAEMQRQQQAARQQAEQTIQQFAEAKDDAGNPVHPHFESVKTEMGALIQAAAASGQELTLDQAYERAVWSRDDLRADLLKAQKEQEAKSSSENRRKAVTKAKHARTPKSTSAPAAKPDEGNQPIGDILNQEYDRIFAGAGR